MGVLPAGAPEAEMLGAKRGWALHDISSNSTLGGEDRPPASISLGVWRAAMSLAQVFQAAKGFGHLGCTLAPMGCWGPGAATPELSVFRAMLQALYMYTAHRLRPPCHGQSLFSAKQTLQVPKQSSPSKDNHSPLSPYYFRQLSLIKRKLEEINIQLFSYGGFFFLCRPQDINLSKHAAHESGFCPRHIQLQRPRTCSEHSPVEPCTCPELQGM